MSVREPVNSSPKSVSSARKRAPAQPGKSANPRPVATASPPASSASKPANPPGKPASAAVKRASAAHKPASAVRKPSSATLKRAPAQPRKTATSPAVATKSPKSLPAPSPQQKSVKPVRKLAPAQSGQTASSPEVAVVYDDMGQVVAPSPKPRPRTLGAAPVRLPSDRVATLALPRSTGWTSRLWRWVRRDSRT